MESAINKVVLSGCAGSDAEIRVLGNNQRLARVSMAVNEYLRNGSGEEVKKTQWFSLTFWNAKADAAVELLKKGTRFAIEGRLQTNHYEAKDGTKRYSTEIVVSELSLANAD